MRSCSLPCVKAHKQHTGCTGKRQQTQFVPLSQFDDKLLKSGTFFSSQFCSFLSSPCTHLAILTTYHEYIVNCDSIEELHCFSCPLNFGMFLHFEDVH